MDKHIGKAIKNKELIETRELFGHVWEVVKKDNIIFYQLHGSYAENSSLIEAILVVDNELRRLYATVGEFVNNVVLCPENVYIYRFKKQLDKDGIDFDLWSWSEGDIDMVDGIRYFCIKIGAEFLSDSDRKRFYFHELGHTFAKEVGVNFLSTHPEYSLPDTEGLVECDARIALELQKNVDMKFSNEFILGLDVTQMANPAELNSQKYNHLLFTNERLSKNPGYASCFLWFLGMAVKIGGTSSKSKDLRDLYMIGRSIILNAAKKTAMRVEFKNELKRYGFEYDLEASRIDLQLWARQKLLNYLNYETNRSRKIQ